MTLDTAIERLPRGELESLQRARLTALVSRVYERVPFYREQLDRGGVHPSRIHDLADLTLLPFTCKSDLRDHYPLGLLAVSRPEVVRIHASSGTTGKPTVVAYTRDDLRTWADLMARTYAEAGVTDSDVVHNAYGYGLFTGGLGFHYRAGRIGAAGSPMSGGNTKRQ